MANTPKKMKDPTEAALSAIQDALNVRDPEPAAADASAATPASQPAPEPYPEESLAEPTWRGRSPTPTANDLFDDEPRRIEDTGPMRRPANDDRESIGQILRSLQRRPARTS